MRTTGWLTGAAVTTILLTSCGTAGGASPAAVDGAGYRLYAVDMQVQSAPISVLDAASGRLERTLPLGTPSPDWSHLYALAHDKQRTSLRLVESHTGKVVSQISFDGWFDLPPSNAIGQSGGLSPNGQWLVLQSSAQRNQTSFMLVPTSFTQRPRRISIEGDFAFDAISNDGTRLYLVESLAASQPGHYRVRLYDVETGELNPHIVIDKREIESGSMTGTRIAGLFGADGRWQYSLYINEHKGAFIHALSLDGPFAWCIDLPSGGTQYEQMMWSLALSPDGGALYAVNPALGKVARINIAADGPSNELSQTSSFTPVGQALRTPGLFTDAVAKGVQIGSATVTHDGKMLIATVDTGTVAIELAGLKLAKTLFSDEGVESVVVSDDGAALFESSWNGPTLREVNPSSGAEIKSLHVDSAFMLYRAERR